MYNTDISSLDKCVKSIINQIKKNLEIIIVDDCSSDIATRNKLKEYMINEHIQVYRTETNGGPSKARNLGLKYAKGKFVLFADADDSLVEKSLPTVMQYIHENSIDTLVYNYNICKNGIPVSKCPDLIYQNEKFMRLSKDNIYKLLVSTTYLNNVWRFIFLKEIIEVNNIRFREDMKNGEDFCFVVNYIEKSERIYYLKDTIYNYEMSDSGITKGFYAGKIIDAVRTLELRLDLLDRKIVQENRKAALNFVVNKYIHVFFDYIALALSRGNIKEINYLYANNSMLRLLKYNGKISFDNRLKRLLIKHRKFNLILIGYNFKEIIRNQLWNKKSRMGETQ